MDSNKNTNRYYAIFVSTEKRKNALGLHRVANLFYGELQQKKYLFYVVAGEGVRLTYQNIENRLDALTKMDRSN